MAKILIISGELTIFSQATVSNESELKKAVDTVRRAHLAAMKGALTEMEQAEDYEGCAELQKQITGLEKTINDET